jgi:hypothetical protein
MANWIPDGFAAKLFALTARYIPLPEGLPPPVLWGEEATVANGSARECPIFGWSGGRLP